MIDPDCPGEGSAKGTNTADDCDVIGDFDKFNLPELLKGTWKNASRIVALEGIGPFSNDAGMRTVISLSSPTVHTVEIKSKGKEFVCDDHCLRFKECAICAHTVAVAYNVGKLEEFVASYEVLLDRYYKQGSLDDPRRKITSG